MTLRKRDKMYYRLKNMKYVLVCLKCRMANKKAEILQKELVDYARFVLNAATNNTLKKECERIIEENKEA